MAALLDLRAVFLFIVMIFALAAVNCEPEAVPAQDVVPVVSTEPVLEPAVSRVRPAEQLALAQIGASEIGLTGSPVELATILAVLRDRAELNGWTLIEAMHRYSSGVFDEERTDHRAWVAFLRPGDRQPARWPAAVSWERYGRPRWEAMYRAAGDALSGAVVPMCDASIVGHWGCRTCGDARRARLAGWVEIPCWVPCESAPNEDGLHEGLCPTRNGYWTPPERLADAD